MCCSDYRDSVLALEGPRHFISSPPSPRRQHAVDGCCRERRLLDGDQLAIREVLHRELHGALREPRACCDLLVAARGTRTADGRAR